VSTHKQPVRHLQPVIDWLKTYPTWTAQFAIEYQGNMTGDVHIVDFPIWAGDGANLLSQTGVSTSETKDIMGGVVELVTINYNLFVRRWGNDDFGRRPTAEFLTDFPQWVREEVRNGTAPKFGDIDQWDEKIIITLGSKWDDVVTVTGLEDYLFQLQIQYRLDYPPT
jgi:hypothetical protein